VDTIGYLDFISKVKAAGKPGWQVALKECIERYSDYKFPHKDAAGARDELYKKISKDLFLLITNKVAPSYITGLGSNSGDKRISAHHYYWFKAYCSSSEFGTKIDESAFGGKLEKRVLTLQEDPDAPDEIRESMGQGPKPSPPTVLHLSGATQDSGLHHYSNALFDVVGRERERERLANFLRCDGPFRWAQLGGAGGQGESRMAWDLIQEAREVDADQGKIGWEAGFLRKPDLEAFGEG